MCPLSFQDTRRIGLTSSCMYLFFSCSALGRRRRVSQRIPHHLSTFRKTTGVSAAGCLLNTSICLHLGVNFRGDREMSTPDICPSAKAASCPARQSPRYALRFDALSLFHLESDKTTRAQYAASCAVYCTVRSNSHSALSRIC